MTGRLKRGFSHEPIPCAGSQEHQRSTVFGTKVLEIRRRSLTLLSILAIFVVTAIPSRQALAQCVTDGLEIPPCCTPATATLPVFPVISDSSKFICFKDCFTQVDQNLCVDIDAPVPANSGGVICGIYVIKFKIKLCGSGQILWRGTMRAQYSRNWMETDVSGNAIGVWRFLLNGDFRPTTFLLGSTSSPNVIPPCQSSFGGRVYMAGYIDYAFDCTSLTWTSAWALNHDCDSIHHPSGSARPAPAGGFHATRSYTFLGPGTSFLVDPSFTPTGTGPVIQEAARKNDWAALPNICLGEEPVSTGGLTIIRQYCPCNLVPGVVAQYDETDLRFNGACGSNGFTLVPAVVPFLQKRIGSWIVPGTFPGQEDLNIDMGNIEYQDGCTGTFSTEFFEGVTTIGGYPSVTYGAVPLGRQAIDLGSSNRNPANLVRQVGRPHVTQYLLNLNSP